MAYAHAVTPIIFHLHHTAIMPALRHGAGDDARRWLGFTLLLIRHYAFT